MNYIKEMNAFYNQMELNPISSSAVSLWHALMHINNKTGWKETFTVAVSVLRTKSGLTESSFQRARAELVQKGYIMFTSRAGNQAAFYQMISLASMMEFVYTGKAETEEKSTSSSTEAETFYKHNFGTPGPYVAEEIANWIGHAGEELVLEAMKRAVDRNKTSWGYVKSILQMWKKAGICSLAQVQAEDAAFKQQPKKKKYISQPKSSEVIPGWFETLEQRQQRAQANTAAKQKMNMDKEILSPEEWAAFLQELKTG